MKRGAQPAISPDREYSLYQSAIPNSGWMFHQSGVSIHPMSPRLWTRGDGNLLRRRHRQAMLIFFIVTASFVKEKGIDVNRPDPSQKQQVMEKGSILIQIDDNNDIWLEGRRIDVRAVRANIERLHAENPEGGVVIQATEDSNTETLIAVMDASRQANVYNVSIAEG